jgi:polar amino acid transport system substrate-binding protein
VKKLVVVLAFISALGLVLAACAPAAAPCPTCPPEVPPTDLGGREIIVAVENAYPPFNMLDEETGEGIGYDYDFFRELCDRANCVPVFEEFAWEGMFEAAQAGEYDITMDGITLLLDRGKIIDYSDPIMEYGMVMVVRADEEEIVDAESLTALTDKLVGVQLATTNEKMAIELVGVDRVKSFADFPLAFTALMAGDVDCVPIDEVAAVGFMVANPGQLKIVGEPLTSGELLALVMPPGSEIQTAVNAALNEMWADGTMDALYEKWFVIE